MFGCEKEWKVQELQSLTDGLLGTLFLLKVLSPYGNLTFTHKLPIFSKLSVKEQFIDFPYFILYNTIQQLQISFHCWLHLVYILRTIPSEIGVQSLPWLIITLLGRSKSRKISTHVTIRTPLGIVDHWLNK